MLQDEMTGPDGNDILITLTTNNCGKVFALDPTGKLLAEADVTGADDDDPAPFLDLMQRAFHRMNMDI